MVVLQQLPLVGAADVDVEGVAMSLVPGENIALPKSMNDAPPVKRESKKTFSMCASPCVSVSGGRMHSRTMKRWRRFKCGSHARMGL